MWAHMYPTEMGFKVEKNMNTYINVHAYRSEQLILDSEAKFDVRKCLYRTLNKPF